MTPPASPDFEPASAVADARRRPSAGHGVVGSGDEGYEGPATLLLDGESIEVSARLAGAFDPIAGRYHWYGRVRAERDLAPLAGRRGALRTPHGAVDTALADLDPWGRARVEGYGPAPFEVATSLP